MDGKLQPKHNTNIMIINKLRNFKAEILPTSNCLGIRICSKIFEDFVDIAIVSYGKCAIDWGLQNEEGYVWLNMVQKGAMNFKVAKSL